MASWYQAARRDGGSGSAASASAGQELVHGAQHPQHVGERRGSGGGAPGSGPSSESRAVVRRHRPRPASAAQRSRSSSSTARHHGRRDLSRRRVPLAVARPALVPPGQRHRPRRAARLRRAGSTCPAGRSRATTTTSTRSAAGGRHRRSAPCRSPAASCWCGCGPPACGCRRRPAAAPRRELASADEGGVERRDGPRHRRQPLPVADHDELGPRSERHLAHPARRARPRG